ncbi:Cysteine protease ATG4B [Echinococcus granulosus]|uniref:Cysteine protease n=1 Tax=Echinococcus granulosus TaxID=6210 RepID=W6UH85_ECHGR|nr:Cysteine protease ATG4B [Echinococcus granulosus]EUB60413.1 Cysteine protease ATG4B [Echinococcus granulosus]
MDAYWGSLAVFANTDTDHPYLPSIDKPVWILGEEHSALNDQEEIANDIRSRLWFTYRRGFAPIGGEKGPTTDTGWGCMHRCGQMLIGQALVHLHLGREWRWNPDRLDRSYLRILKMFEDKPTAPYSIHKIASKAASDDNKTVSSWLGPNTVAQILKKLSASDRWTNLVVHVTTEDGIVMQEIKSLCRRSASARNSKIAAIDESTCNKDTSPPSPISHDSLHLSAERKNSDRPVIVSSPITVEVDDESVAIILPPVYNMSFPSGDDSSPTSEVFSVLTTTTAASSTWHPLFLVLPLRLGLHEFNMRYAPALQGLFKLRQCVGVIGGRPNHALWLIGSVGDDEVLCLDPHTTQAAAILGEPAPGVSEEAASLDGSFHCTTPLRIPLRRLDPSLAVAFVCRTEADFDDLCAHLLADKLSSSLFEVHETRPRNIPPPSFTSLRTPEEWGELFASSGPAIPASPTPLTSKCKADGDFELV